MQIFKHLTANEIHLKSLPFLRELSMEAYLIENETVLSLDDKDFKDIEILEAELHLKNGRAKNKGDGRIDILATYSSEYIAVIELKLGQLDNRHLEQLEEYLEVKENLLKQYPDILDKKVSPNPKWIGLIVGDSINSTLAEKIKDGYLTPDGVQIAALTIQRYRGDDGSIFVVTETYFNNKNSKDTSEYIYAEKTYGKGQLVLAVVKNHCTKNPEINYSQLKADFPDILQGSNGIIATVEEAQAVIDNAKNHRKRHFMKDEDLIKLKESTIAICSQWGIGNINRFIERARELGHNIQLKKG